MRKFIKNEGVHELLQTATPIRLPGAARCRCSIHIIMIKGCGQIKMLPGSKMSFDFNTFLAYASGSNRNGCTPLRHKSDSFFAEYPNGSNSNLSISFCHLDIFLCDTDKCLEQKIGAQPDPGHGRQASESIGFLFFCFSDFILRLKKVFDCAALYLSVPADFLRQSLFL